MIEKTPLYFYPGTGNPPALPLARFLPPVPTGMASAWLKENVPRGSWLLDPLGSSPSLALEAARAGYRVLVACNNPILSFMIETLAAAPRPTEFQSALADLAAAKRGDERLEKHLLGLYVTECENCGEHIPAEALLWRKGDAHPYARIYHCNKCNDSPPGERPVTQFDLDRLHAMGGDRLQRSRALQRVIMDEDDHRAGVEEALENYLPRPLYVLFTLINRIEGLGLPPERVRLLHALLISALDAGNTLWPWPGGRARPRQLSVPPQFREANLWLTLEEAVAEWTQHGESPVPVTHWPQLPGETAQHGTICLFRGRVKALMPLPEEVQPRAVLTVFPRPSQAFWTLSALWSGWLWGAEAALPMRSVLDRRRYDWNWHASAVHSALAVVNGNLPAETPVLGILPELASGFLSAVLVAAQAAGMALEGVALRPDAEIALGKWQPSGLPPGGPSPLSTKATGSGDFPSSAELEQAARAAIRRDLEKRGEPAPYLVEYAAGLQALIIAGVVPHSLKSIPGEALTRLQAILSRTFADRSFLKLYGGPAEEGGWWWLEAPGQRLAAPQPAGGSLPTPLDAGQLPLADQLEIEVVRYLQKCGSCTLGELDAAMCRRFPGLFTPPRELVLACLESYAAPLTGQPEMWQLSASEAAAARRNDLQEVIELLDQVGARLGFHLVEHGNALAWISAPAQKVEWLFFRMASSIASRYVFNQLPVASQRAVLVLPGSRSRLLRLKLNRDPHLAEGMQGWRILKYRHLREIAARPKMTLALWESLLDEDPLTDEVTQMQLFT